VIDAKQKSTRNENRDQGTHTGSLALGSGAGKSPAKGACASKQQNPFAAPTMAVLRRSNGTRVFNQECSDCASSAGFPIDRPNALQ
jgi:hypothetical protein